MTKRVGRMPSVAGSDSAGADSSSGNGSPPLRVLLVEDNEGDVTLARKAFEYGNFRHELHVVETGLDAIAFVRRRGRFSGEPRPDLILLDLGLPGLSGQDVLAEMKADSTLRRIPVVIYSGSVDEGDVERAYDLHAAAYVAKPDSLEGFVELIAVLERYAGPTLVLPSR